MRKLPRVLSSLPSTSAFHEISVAFYLFIWNVYSNFTYVFVCFEVDSHYGAQTGLKLNVPLATGSPDITGAHHHSQPAIFGLRIFLLLAAPLTPTRRKAMGAHEGRSQQEFQSCTELSLASLASIFPGEVSGSRHTFPSNFAHQSHPSRLWDQLPEWARWNTGLLQGEIRPLTFSRMCFLIFDLVS